MPSSNARASRQTTDSSRKPTRGKKTKRERNVEGSERARTESPPQPLPDLNPWSKLEGL